MTKRNGRIAGHKLWKGSKVSHCSRSGKYRQSFQWLVNSVWTLQVNLVKSGCGARIVRPDSSQRVMEKAGDCNEPVRPRKCEVLLASSFEKW